MRLVVTGGRDFEDEKLVRKTLEALAPRVVYVGDCPTGVDRFVRMWCESKDILFEVFKADWGIWGKKAGPVRNNKMCEKAVAEYCEVLLAFPGGKGTANCVLAGKANGMTILRVEPVDNLF